MVEQVTKILGSLSSRRCSGSLEERRNNVTSQIKKKLDEFESKIPNYIFAIRRFAEDKSSNTDDERISGIGDRKSSGANQLMVIEIENNDVYLKKRREQLQNIYKISAEMKEMSDAMVVNVHEQGELLDQVQDKVTEAINNAEGAESEIKKADEISRGNRKRIICMLVIVGVVVLATTAILLSVFLPKK